MASFVFDLDGNRCYFDQMTDIHCCCSCSCLVVDVGGIMNYLDMEQQPSIIHDSCLRTVVDITDTVASLIIAANLMTTQAKYYGDIDIQIGCFEENFNFD